MILKEHAIGIVGSEAKKFTSRTEELAREVIRNLFISTHATLVVSGACHLGGVDRFAIEEAEKCDLAIKEFPPRDFNWDTGYRPRNILIAKRSQEVYCITVDTLPVGYDGMRFAICYHCRTSSHVKSGGCWTVKYAREKLGRKTGVYVVSQQGTITLFEDTSSAGRGAE